MLFNATPPPDNAERAAEQQALLKQSMIETAAEAQTRMQTANIIKNINSAEEETARLENKLAAPVENPVIELQNLSIGAFSGQNIFNAVNNASAVAAPPKKPYQIISQNKINQESETLDADALKSAVQMAYYDFEDGTITLKKFNFDASVNDTLKNKIENNNTETGMLLKNNSLAKYITLLHEAIHLKHNEKDGMYQPGDTPENAARKDRLTENIANATEYLAIAELYTNLKKQGVAKFCYTTEFDGKTEQNTMPLENMLDLYPGLKDAYNKKDFNPKDPKSVRNIVEAASTYWHKEKKNLYTPQDIRQAKAAAEETPSFSRMVELAKENKSPVARYDQTAKRMLKNTYIGSNVNVDLSHCRDLLDTMSWDEAKDLTDQNNIKAQPRPSNETILAINDYLEKKGLKTDEAKQEYLEEAFIYITHRDPKADLELKNLMLKDGGSITYADGLIETKIPDTNLRTIAEGRNGTVQIIGAFPDLTANREQNTARAAKASNEHPTATAFQTMQSYKSQGR